jgi:predicted O-methyltransferase YrrM
MERIWETGVVPRLQRASRYRRYRKAAATLLRRNPRWLFAFTKNSVLYPVQNAEEFVPFLRMLMQKPPASVLEIGTAQGGTFFMLCQAATVDACLATLDLQPPSADLVRSFARSQQTVVSLEGDSKAPETRAHVDSLFPNGLDLLFIDGDHSLEGVSADFDGYAPLVCPGGLVVFHDIVEDNLQRTGFSTTKARSGGVPQYWREFKDSSANAWVTREFIRSWDQDGMGIGVAKKVPN